MAAATTQQRKAGGSPLQGTDALQYIVQDAQQLGLDPFAVIADARGEGLGGGVGDQGHAFGPFQLNDAGGLFPSSIDGQDTSSWSQSQKQAWAWSQVGIDYALKGMAARGAAGLSGIAALHNIVYNFENPKDKNGALSTRTTYYNMLEKATGGSTEKLGKLPIAAETVGGNYLLNTSPGAAPGSSRTPDQLYTSGNCIAHVSVLGIGIPYPDFGCIASPFVTAANQVGDVFSAIVSFFANIVSYLRRGGLLLGGAALVILGFVLLGRTAIS